MLQGPERGCPPRVTSAPCPSRRSTSANGTTTSYEHRGSPAVEQLGGTLILSGNEFPRPGTQLSIAAVGPLKPRTKTIVAENIIKGPLKIENRADKRAKVIVANNADDSDDPDQQ